MATKKEEPRGRVRTTWEWEDWYPGSSPRDGWILPSKLKVDAELPGDVQVHIDVDVVEGRARARSVTVSTNNPHGVGWTALSKVPARDLVGTAVLTALHKTAPGENKGERRLLPPEKKDANVVREVVQAAVGYNPNTKGFLREVAS